MKPEHLFSNAEIITIGRILRCALMGEPILPHTIIPTLTGVKVNNALRVVVAWPNVDLNEDVTRRIVRGVFANLLNYPHKQWDKITRETGLSKDGIRDIFSKLKKHI